MNFAIDLPQYKEIVIYSVVVNKRGSSIEPQIKTTKKMIMYWPDSDADLERIEQSMRLEYQMEHRGERVIGLSPEEEIRFIARKHRLDAEDALKEIKGAEHLMKIGKEFASLSEEIKE